MVTLIITPFITTHEPPSRVWDVRFVVSGLRMLCLTQMPALRFLAVVTTRVTLDFISILFLTTDAVYHDSICSCYWLRVAVSTTNSCCALPVHFRLDVILTSISFCDDNCGGCCTFSAMATILFD